ncbi:MAG: hypothetical protein HYU66_28275 [Armatimonadetes bacterium]|nr:hypothetical protein [Armatimonadota bacterium]
MRDDPVFASRHDLDRLVDEAAFYDFVPERMIDELTAAVQEVVVRWRNDHRYRPARMVQRWLRDQGLDRRVRGDQLKYSSGQIVDAALTVVQTGERRWNSRSSSASS